MAPHSSRHLEFRYRSKLSLRSRFKRGCRLKSVWTLRNPPQTIWWTRPPQKWGSWIRPRIPVNVSRKSTKDESLADTTALVSRCRTGSRLWKQASCRAHHHVATNRSHPASEFQRGQAAGPRSAKIRRWRREDRDPPSHIEAGSVRPAAPGGWAQPRAIRRRSIGPLGFSTARPLERLAPELSTRNHHANTTRTAYEKRRRHAGKSIRTIFQRQLQLR